MRARRHAFSNLQGQRILVTGGAGFIGSHLCDRLLQRGARVVCVDNLFTGALANIRPLLNHRNFSFLEHDVCDPLSIAGPIHGIYNLACPASPKHYQRDPIGTMKTCVSGAGNLLELARRRRCRILQASTSEVYGDPEVHPQPESYLGHVNTTGPRACYDEGKRAAEALFFDYHRLYGVEIKVARIFNTYGPRMMEDDGRVVSNFISQALRGDTITIHGDGRQTRSFCFVDDLVRGLESLMDSPAAITGPCNLGNPTEVTIEDVARTVIALTGSQSRLQRLPRPEDDPRRRRPVIDRAVDLLSWRPEIDLEDGLRRTIDYFALKLATPAEAQMITDLSAVRATLRRGERLQSPAQQ